MTLFISLKNADDFYKVFWHKIGSITLRFIHILIIQTAPLKFACGIFERHLHFLFSNTTDINKVEAVQRRAARWATRDYRYNSSVAAILKDLNWRPLDQRRIDSRLVMMYKVTYDLVAIPASDYLV